MLIKFWLYLMVTLFGAEAYSVVRPIWWCGQFDGAVHSIWIYVWRYTPFEYLSEVHSIWISKWEHMSVYKWIPSLDIQSRLIGHGYNQLLLVTTHQHRTQWSSMNLWSFRCVVNEAQAGDGREHNKQRLGNTTNGSNMFYTSRVLYIEFDKPGKSSCIRKWI